MREVWLKNNVRMLQCAALLVGALFTIGAAVLAAFWPNESPAGRVIGLSILIGASIGGLIVAAMARLPRLAYESGYLSAYLRGASPIRLPIEIVECFLLGQGPSLLRGEKHARTETTTLVIKLSDRAEEWSHRAVDHRLAAWCDGYITIRGTWTEPLNLALVNRLNERLAEVHRNQPRRVA